MPTEADYTIADLARLTGLSVRTIRYYLAQGLIPASGESGPGAHYGQGHLDRLQLIKRLQAEYLPNAEIRRRLSVLTDEQVASIVSQDPPPAKPSESALDYVRGVLGTTSVMEEPPQFLARSMAPPPREAPLPDDVDAMPSFPRPMVLGSAVPAQNPAPTTDDTATHSEPQTLERSQWERLSLSPDVELHVRRPLSRHEQKRVDRLITIARQVLKEGRS